MDCGLATDGDADGLVYIMLKVNSLTLTISSYY